MLRRLAVILAIGWALPAGAGAEQASQAGSVAAGGLDVGKSHACALVSGVGVRCWGYAPDGELGYASTETIGDDEVPAAAGPVDLGAGRSAVAVSAGSFHTCAVLDDRTVRCWGFGGSGRLGYGNETNVGDKQAPGSVGAVDVGGPVEQITAGFSHSCAVLTGGAVRCWGFGGDGRLGYGNTNNIGDKQTPGSVAPVRLGASATAVTAGYAHTCALLTNQTVRCWGAGFMGELGYGNSNNVGDVTTPDSAGPVDLGAGSKVVAITAGDLFTCALLADKTVHCWGYGGNGRLGYGNQSNVGDRNTPASAGAVVLGGPVKAISAGDSHACALLEDGSVRCWGYGGGGRLGYANTDSVGDDETPASAGPVDLGPGRTALAISAGTTSTCARLDNGSVRCWGSGANGQLGYCNTANVGDTQTPGSAGPVGLMPGDGGAACPPLTPPPISPSPATPTPSPPGPSVAPPPSPNPPVAAPNTLAAFAAEKTRAGALRRCLRKASGPARRQRRGGRFRRVSAMRQFTRAANQRRAGCLTRYARTPGRVNVLKAKATDRHTITLTFNAPGTDHANPPAAHSYLIKQSPHPIRTPRDFRRAQALCKAATCRFAVTEIDATISLTVTQLRAHTTYYYAIAARDNVTARTGPRSQTITARTP